MPYNRNPHDMTDDDLVEETDPAPDLPDMEPMRRQTSSVPLTKILDGPIGRRAQLQNAAAQFQTLIDLRGENGQALPLNITIVAHPQGTEFGGILPALPTLQPICKIEFGIDGLQESILLDTLPGQSLTLYATYLRIAFQYTDQNNFVWTVGAMVGLLHGPSGRRPRFKVSQPAFPATQGIHAIAAAVEGPANNLPYLADTLIIQSDIGVPIMVAFYDVAGALVGRVLSDTSHQTTIRIPGNSKVYTITNQGAVASTFWEEVEYAL